MYIPKLGNVINLEKLFVFPLNHHLDADKKGIHTQ